MDRPRISRDPSQLFTLPASQWRAHGIATGLLSVATIFAVGLALRLLFLGSKSLWLDEALSLGFAANPQQLWGGGYDHSHPPLYYALLHYWLRLGNSEFMLRLSSALVGSLAVPLGYLLASSLGGRSIALSTGWLMALSPLLVWYAQELRSYSLLLAFGLLMALALVRLVVRASRQAHLLWWLIFIAAMSASLYTHYIALALIPVQLGLIAVLSLQERTTRSGLLLWLAAWPVVLLLYWPWLTSPGMSAFVQLFRSSNLYPIELLTYYLPITTRFASTLIVIAALLSIPMMLLIMLLVVRLGKTTWNRWAASPAVRYGLLLFVLALVLASVVPRGYTVKKLLVHLWPFGLLVVGWVFPWRISNRFPLALLLAASLVGSLANVLLVPKDQWRETAAYLAVHGEPNDIVFVVPNYHAQPLGYYLARISETTDGELSADARFDVRPVGAVMNERDLEALMGKGQRIWLIYHTVNFRLVDPQRNLEQWLSAHMHLADQFSLYKIEAMLYTPPQP